MAHIWKNEEIELLKKHYPQIWKMACANILQSGSIKSVDNNKYRQNDS